MILKKNINKEKNCKSKKKTTERIRINLIEKFSGMMKFEKNN